MQSNLFSLVITLLTIMAAILLASQKLTRDGFSIRIEYQPGREQHRPDMQTPYNTFASRSQTLAPRPRAGDEAGRRP